jgi:hypothetical protein
VIVGVAKLRETSVRAFLGDSEFLLDFVGEEFADPAMRGSRSGLDGEVGFISAGSSRVFLRLPERENHIMEEVATRSCHLPFSQKYNRYRKYIRSLIDIHLYANGQSRPASPLVDRRALVHCQRSLIRQCLDVVFAVTLAMGA